MDGVAKSVEEYLRALSPDRQIAMRELRQFICDNLPSGYEEVMNWGMIAYQVPLAIFPDTYNSQPLLYAALASQKNYMSLYLNSVYTDEQRREKFEKEFQASGKKLNMGKSCVRFKQIDDLPLDVVARVIASTSPAEFITLYQKARLGKKIK